MKKFTLLLVCGLIAIAKSYATAWTTVAAGPVTTLTNWSDGVTSPTSFTTPGDTWTITMNMTSSTSFAWIIGTASSAPATLIIATGGTITFSGSGGITVYGNFVLSGGTMNYSALGTHNCYVYGNAEMNAGVIDPSGAFGFLHFKINGNFNVNGPITLIAGTLGGIVFHMARPSALGTMFIKNTSTATWTGGGIIIDTACTAQLDGNFSMSSAVSVDGTLICPAGYSVSGSGQFKVNGVATLEIADPGGVDGNVMVTGTKTFDAAANYTFNGLTAQVTGSSLPTALVAPSLLTINNSAGVTLSQNTTTTGTLSLINGILHTGTKTMTTPGSAGAVTGAGVSNYVDGTLIKTIAGLSSVSYEVGALSYAPMDLNFDASGTSGSLGVRCNNGMHAAIATSYMLTSNIVNRYWTITNYSAAGVSLIRPVAHYNLSDIIGGSNVSFATQKYSGGAWLPIALGTSNSASPYTSSLNAGIALASLTGDYVFGKSCSTPIIGADNICTIGSTIALSDSTSGGTWSSTNTVVATVNASGVVTGVSIGATTIVYNTGVCSVSKTVYVGVLPITGVSSVCPLSTAQLSSATPGGIWSSSNSAVATISVSGIVYGSASGIVNISYTVGTCPAVGMPLTVDTLPSIIGPSSVYTGSAIQLSNATSGGVWSSGNTALATVSTTGIVTGVTAGSVDISYTVGSCAINLPINVMFRYYIMADSIGSPDSICNIPKFFVKINGVSSLLRLKTYYGDGSKDSIPLTTSSTMSYANATHSYSSPGCYTVKQIIYNNNIPQDSITFAYHADFCNILSFKLYADLNGDCVKNSTEAFNVSPVSIRIDSAGIPVDTISATSGFYYKAHGPAGTIYAFSIIPAIMYTSCPASGFIYDTIQSAITAYPIKYFAVNCGTSSSFDLSVYALVPVTGRHDQWGNIYVRNNSCMPVNATVTLHYSSKYGGSPTFHAAASGVLPTSYSVGNVVWNITGLAANSTSQRLYYSAWTAGSTLVTAGDTVHEDITVTPVTGDMIPVNNTVIKVDTVKASCDPNFVEVLPNSCFKNDTQFQYTIHFENTGNDTAHNIYVLDTISSYLDVNTMKLVMATADMDIVILKEGPYTIAKFDFPNIMLPDSSHHGLCNGAVIFTIKNKTGIPDGTVIQKRAGIYFDINEVVMTNTTENTKGCPHPENVAEVSAHTTELFPNPTTNELTIKTELDAYSSYTITNNVGQVLMQQTLSGVRTTVNVSALAPGLYYVVLKGESGSKAMKFVKM